MPLRSPPAGGAPARAAARRLVPCCRPPDAHCAAAAPAAAFLAAVRVRSGSALVQSSATCMADSDPSLLLACRRQAQSPPHARLQCNASGLQATRLVALLSAPSAKPVNASGGGCHKRASGERAAAGTAAVGGRCQRLPNVILPKPRATAGMGAHPHSPLTAQEGSGWHEAPRQLAVPKGRGGDNPRVIRRAS